MYRRASKQRDTQGTKRAKCAHVGDTNNNGYTDKEGKWILTDSGKELKDIIDQ